MLTCPTCGTTAGLRPQNLEQPPMRVESCKRCNGIWIRAENYQKWLDRNPPVDAPTDPANVSEREYRDGPFLRRCPSCEYILGRYRVGHDVPFTVDRCHNCGGIWLDAHEWEALRERHLHARLQAIFTAEWQSDIRRRAAEEKEDAYRRRVLGDDGYERLLQFEEWVKHHPYKQLILELLVESLAPKHLRHFQEADRSE